MTPFEEGYSAAKSGQSDQENPYNSGTYTAFEWENGFDAFWANNPL